MFSSEKYVETEKIGSFDRKRFRSASNESTCSALTEDSVMNSFARKSYLSKENRDFNENSGFYLDCAEIKSERNLQIQSHRLNKVNDRSECNILNFCCDCYNNRCDSHDCIQHSRNDPKVHLNRERRSKKRHFTDHPDTCNRVSPSSSVNGNDRQTERMTSVSTCESLGDLSKLRNSDIVSCFPELVELKHSNKSHEHDVYFGLSSRAAAHLSRTRASGFYLNLPLEWWDREEGCKAAKALHMDRVDNICRSREDLVLLTTLWSEDIVLEPNMFPYDTPYGVEHYTLWSILDLSHDEIQSFVDRWLSQRMPHVRRWQYDDNSGERSINLFHVHIFVETIPFAFKVRPEAEYFPPHVLPPPIDMCNIHRSIMDEEGEVEN